MDVQWYPGHMTKARRAMQEDIRLIDLVIELVDARAPLSSRNPDIDELGKGRARLILLCKADLADEAGIAEWERWFQGKGYFTVAVDARSRKDLRRVDAEIAKACAEKKERDRKRGILNRPVRAMVAGIPNVGKSTFINSFAKKACTKTGNKPGVTRGKQWIRLNREVELLDTPGILWPKFDDPKVGERLAMIGSVRDEVVGVWQLAIAIITFLTETCPGRLSDRYGLNEERDTEESDTERRYSEENGAESGTGSDAESCSREGHDAEGDEAETILAEIALARKCIKKGGEADVEKAARIVLDEFRSGALGRVMLEHPPIRNSI